MRLLSEVRERVRALFQRRREEREMEEELRFHIAMETEANLQKGMSPKEARRQAMIAFGGLERVKEEVREARGLGVLDDLWRDFRIALRRLVRAPVFTLTAVATLALGIGATAAIFTLVNGVLLQPLPYPDSDRLVAVGHEASGVELTMTGLSPGTYLHYRDNNRVFEEMGAYQERVRTVTEPGSGEMIRVASVTPELFPVLGVTSYVGRLPTAADHEWGGSSGVLISHDLWVRRYGADRGIVGRTIEIEGRPHVVVGVAEPGFHFPHPETQVWVVWPQESHPGSARAGVRGLFLDGVARLRPGVSVEEAAQDLDRLTHSLPDAYPDVTTEQLREMGLRATVTPFKDEIIGDVRIALLMLLGTSGFLLLITWANATNLTLVRSERGSGEVAVARALGATDGHLARRFLSESFLLAVPGGALGLALAYVAVEARFGFQPEQIPRLHEVGVNGTVLGLILALTLFSGLLMSAVCLLSARRPRAAGALTGTAGRSTAGRKEQTGRHILVAGQVALALTLLVGSALMARSFWELQQVELGFTSEGAFTFHLPISPGVYGADYHPIARIHDDVLTRLRRLPGVEAAEAGTSSGFPLTPVPGYYQQAIAVADRAGSGDEIWPHALFGFATAGYFRAMGIPLIDGRTFRSEDTALETPGVIVSAALARDLFDGADPIGRRVRWAGTAEFPDYTVVGVAGDVPGETIREGGSRTLYLPHIYPPRAETVTGAVHIYVPSDEAYVVRTSRDPLSLLPEVRQAVEHVDPRLVMTRVGTLDRIVTESMARTRLTMLLLLIGAGTALLLGIIGIYGVLAYTVRQRTAELGVRIALGALPADVVRMVVRQGAALTLAGIAAGLLAAFALTRYLDSLLYEVSPSDPAAFAAMAALLFVIALAASYLPARRAGRIDPTRALKGE